MVVSHSMLIKNGGQQSGLEDGDNIQQKPGSRNLESFWDSQSEDLNWICPCDMRWMSEQLAEVMQDVTA